MANLSIKSRLALVFSALIAIVIIISTAGSSSVLAAVKRMQDGLIEIVAEVRRDADAVSSASQQIAAGNMDLSARTETQARSLAEMAGSVDEFGSTVRQNADHARQANQLAQSASQVAAHGGEVVGHVVDTMQGINESSRKISGIRQVTEVVAEITVASQEQSQGVAQVGSAVTSLDQITRRNAGLVEEMARTA